MSLSKKVSMSTMN